MPRLVIYRDGEASRVFELAGNRPLSIGRAKSSNLILDDPSISRLHAVVRTSPDGQWQIIDRGSINGIKVNGRAIKEATLRPNDEIITGVYRIRFEEPDVRGVLAQDTVQLPQQVVRDWRDRHIPTAFFPLHPSQATLEARPTRAQISAERLRASRSREQAACSASARQPDTGRSGYSSRNVSRHSGFGSGDRRRRTRLCDAPGRVADGPRRFRQGRLRLPAGASSLPANGQRGGAHGQSDHLSKHHRQGDAKRQSRAPGRRPVRSFLFSQPKHRAVRHPIGHVRSTGNDATGDSGCCTWITPRGGRCSHRKT